MNIMKDIFPSNFRFGGGQSRIRNNNQSIRVPRKQDPELYNQVK
jgi:hypothetical protein